MSNPFTLVKKLLGYKKSVRLEGPREEVEQHLRDTHSDVRREEDLEECPELLQPEDPTGDFKESEPKWKEDIF